MIFRLRICIARPMLSEETVVERSGQVQTADWTLTVISRHQQIIHDFVPWNCL